LRRANVIDAGDREVTVLLRLEQPRAVLGGVLSDDECQQLIELVGPARPFTVSIH